MIVIEIRLQQCKGTLSAEHDDDTIKEFATGRAYPPFCIRILPRTAWGNAGWFKA
jgi:hypothetical protein